MLTIRFSNEGGLSNLGLGRKVSNHYRTV